jgi:tetratricopeptide (TPR) repeat protein
MCPEAHEYLQSGIKCHRLGLLDRALAEFVTAVGLADDPDLRSVAMTHQSNVLRAQCQWQAAIEVARQSRTIAQHAGLTTRAAEAWIAEANVYLARGEFEAALPVFHALLESTPDPRLRGVALQNIGNIRAQCGVLGQAETAFCESFACFERAGYVLGQAIARNNQGRARLDRGDAAAAVPILESALKLAREAEDGELVASALVNLSEALLPTDAERAEDLACTALGHFRTSGSHLSHVECLRLLGDIHARRGHGEQAVALYQQGLAIANAQGARVEVAALQRRIQEVLSRSGAGGARREATAVEG